MPCAEISETVTSTSLISTVCPAPFTVTWHFPLTHECELLWHPVINNAPPTASTERTDAERFTSYP